jgi:uncharacterized protein (TIGR00299 family) protein
MQQTSYSNTFDESAKMVERSTSSRTRLVFLDLIGGIAGDMFAAAMCDLEPQLEQECLDTISRIWGLPPDVQAKFRSYQSGTNFGKQFSVQRMPSDKHSHQHVGFRDVLDILNNSGLGKRGTDRASDIFEHLARCEGKAHGVPVDAVVFHEVGGWDSIVDIILAACIIDRFDDHNWACGPIPAGRGTVHCAHGDMPVPTPATTELLRGFTVYQDEHDGERVTPTGAAILCHLQPAQMSGMPASELLRFGSGYGSKVIPGLSNVLRCYLVEPAQSHTDLAVAVIEFDIDDQSPEDLALAIDTIRESAGVLDVVQTPIVAKKGRLGSTIRVLADLASCDAVADFCLSATSTIGVRWHHANRRILDRTVGVSQSGSRTSRSKRVQRPDGESTVKLESDDLAAAGQSYGERERLRASATLAGIKDAETGTNE